MSQQYPQQPEPAKKKRGKGCLFAFIGAAVLVVIIVAASTDGSKGTSDSGSSTKTGTHKSAAKTPEQSPLDAFRSYVAKHGTTTEKAAVKHTTKIQGADSENDILDSADVYTDYSGGMMGGHANDGKLIASAFADWQQSRGKDSKNGLVTIYDKSGDLLSNGKY